MDSNWLQRIQMVRGVRVDHWMKRFERVSASPYQRTAER